MARVIINGQPGSPYVNNTGQVLYQFVCALINTCGACLQYHLKISTAWPIPLHHNCRCRQIRIDPGKEAPHDFVDYRMTLESMPAHDRATAIGTSNDKLLRASLATFGDIVTPYRVRDFAEVVALRQLSLKRMVAVGVAAWIAKRAILIPVGTDDEERKRHDRKLLDALAGPDASQARLIEELDEEEPAPVRLPPGDVEAAIFTALVMGWKPKRR
jgi:hypothetical protein